MSRWREIQAGQVIYGKLPREDAFVGAHDFRPLAYTRDWVDEATVNGIQLYLLGDTPPPRDAPPRRIFAVVEDPQYGPLACLGELRPASFEDVAGRFDQYVAHFLLFRGDKTDDFVRLAGANPFQIFDQFRFVQSIGEALDPRRRTDEPTTVGFEPQRDVGIKGLQMWAKASDKDSLKHLVTLALGARSLRAETSPKILALIGKHEQRELTLAAVMALLSPEDRLHCSFNTDAVGGVSSPDPAWLLWACGMPFALVPAHSAEDMAKVAHKLLVEGAWE